MAFIQGMVKHSEEMSCALESPDGNCKTFGALRLKIVNVIGVSMKILFP